MVQSPWEDACIVRTVIDLGHNFGLRVVAEGAEDRESSDLLASWGCDVAQGYFYSRALPPDELLEWLTERGGKLETMTSLPSPPPSPYLAPLSMRTRDPSLREPWHARNKQSPGRDAVASVEDRRGATRYFTKDTTALIGWVDGDLGRKVTSTLKNISADGALVETDSEVLPAEESFVMIRLVSEVTDWVMKARVVNVTTPKAPGRTFFRKRQKGIGNQLRLAFLESCPYEFFKASILGFVVEKSASEILGA